MESQIFASGGSAPLGRMALCGFVSSAFWALEFGWTSKLIILGDTTR
jgi:hypothetical protein